MRAGRRNRPGTILPVSERLANDSWLMSCVAGQNGCPVLLVQRADRQALLFRLTGSPPDLVLEYHPESSP
jgi:hypothetical protein